MVHQGFGVSRHCFQVNALQATADTVGEFVPNLSHGRSGGTRGGSGRSEQSRLHRLNDLAEADVSWRSRQHVATCLAAFTGNNVRSLQFIQDLDQEARRDIFALGNVLELYNGAAIVLLRQTDGSATGIFEFLRNPH